jgi:hypothetical protein
MPEFLVTIFWLGVIAGLFFGMVYLVVEFRGYMQLLCLGLFLSNVLFGLQGDLGMYVWLAWMTIFVFLALSGFIGLLDDAGTAVKNVTQPREVHHYHRITIDQNGNPVEVTEYTEEK